MFTRGEFEFGSTAAKLVPQQSVVVRDGFQQVFVVGADQRAKLYKVTVGRRQGELLEITQGLPDEAKVVVRGAGFLTAGRPRESGAMNVSAWSIRNPVPSVVLFILLSLAGMLAFKSMKVQNFP